jgi:rod shape-determining protein MreB
MAVGNEAAALQGRLTRSVKVTWPVVDGEVTDPEAIVALIRSFWYRQQGWSFLLRPELVVSVPHKASSAYREALVKALLELGVRRVVTVSQPLAAAIGAGVPVAEAAGTFLVQLGAGVSEAAVIGLGTVIKSTQVTLNSNWLDSQISEILSTKNNIRLSRDQLKNCKHELGRVVLSGTPPTKLVVGQHIVTGAPTEVTLDSELFLPSWVKWAESVREAIQRLLVSLPPELTSDVIDRGILLSGGAAQLGGLDAYLVQHLGVPVSVVEDPDTVVIKGIGTVLENLDLYQASLSGRQERE